jgi:protein kinase C substrate 80K-H
LNDDYCDCPDGSDEPGTSACSYVSPLSPKQPSRYDPAKINDSQALPGFYCKNKGHIASYVPFTNVNDGVCDYELCCDGSEEWEGVGGIKCEDRCAKIGKEWKKQDEARQKSLGSANRRRKELVAEAGRLRKEVEDRIQTLQAQIKGQEVKVEALSKTLAEVERSEKGKVVRSAGKGGKLGVLTSLAKDKVNELTDSLRAVKDERDAAKSKITDLEAILKRFKEEYNPNFNDEGVKRAVKAWEDYAASQPAETDGSARDRDLEDLMNPSSESAIKWEEYEDNQESDVELRKSSHPPGPSLPNAPPVYKFEEYLPTPLRTWVDEKLRALRVTLIENGILADTNTDSPESKRVTDAREQLSSAQSALDNDRTELTKHTDDLSTDYGPDAIFRALKGVCVNQDSGEYTYEHCFLDKTTQKPKKGGGHTGMGNFARIERITVDEDLRADGKGLGSGERIALRYENGQHCWNGPNRSTLVVLACAEKDEIWKIVEEEKCVYRMEMGTPAVCGVQGQQAGAPAHNEL